MYKIKLIDDIEKGVADVYLINDDEIIEYKTELDYDLAESYIAALYENYSLKDDTRIEDDYNNNTTIYKFLEL